MSKDVFPALPQQTARRVLDIAQLKIQEKPEEDFTTTRFEQSFDLSELQAVLEVMNDVSEEEYNQAHHDEEQRILEYEAQCLLDEMDESDWEEFFS
jgi:hypothetical protein